MHPLPTTTTTNNIQGGEKRIHSSRSTRRRRFLVVFCTALVFLGFYSYSNDDNLTSLNIFSSLWNGVKSLASCHSPGEQMSSSTPTVASAEGWHLRVQAQVNHAEFKPKKSDLLLTVLLNSQVEPEGFTMALLRPSSVVDASGRIYTISDEDFVAFEQTIEAVKTLPRTGEFMGQWRVKHPRTGYPIDRVLISGEQEERSVYGWSKDTRLLEKQIMDYTELPIELQRLVGWAKEGRAGYVKGTRDEEVIQQVMALIES